MRKLVQGGTVVTATNSSVADVLIDGEEIVAVGSLGDVDAELIDASGCYVLPGLIDNHTHMAMPFGGTNSIDDYDTGTRAAAAGGTTCIVDFVIQQHPDGLRSSLEEWSGRAEGAAHVDYGFHIAITQADDGTFADMEPMVEEGICTFKVFLAYKGALMVTDDLFFRVLENTRDLGALTMVHCENGWVIDVLVERALAAGQTDPIYHALTRPESVEAEATSRSVRLAEQTGAGVYIVHVTCGLAADEIAAGQARGVKVYGETCLQYLTNTVHDLERPGLRGWPLRLLTPAAGGAQPGAPVERSRPRRARERLDRPLPVQQRAEGARPRRLLEDPERPRDDPAPAREAVGPRGGERADHAERARRHDLDHDRPPLRPAPQGIDRAGDGCGPGGVRPVDAVRVLHAYVAHERGLRPVRRRELHGQRAPHALSRNDGLRPRRDRHATGSRPLRAALARRADRRGIVNADRVLDDLRELANLTGGPDGARRVCWTDEWTNARDFLRSRLGELPVELTVDAAGNLWAGMDGDGDGFVIVGSHVDSVPAGGWLDGALGVFTAVEALRSQAESGTPPVGLRLVDWADEEGARFGRSLFGSSCCAGTLDPDEVRDLRDKDGERLEDVVARYDVELDRALESGAELRGARAYIEAHIEQGPVLESKGEPAATVLGTCGVERHVAIFTGETAHAGATPMPLRRDTFMATAQAALAIREVGLSHEGGVCTVGGATSEPGVVTAVPGRTEMLLDQRHLDPDELAAMLAGAREACERAAADHGCEVELKHLWSIPPIPFDDRLIGFAREAVRAAGGKDTAIPSGPLHDAAEMARLIPTVMIFSSSSPPVSHTKEEDTPEADLRVAIEAYGRTVEAMLASAAAGDLPPRE